MRVGAVVIYRGERYMVKRVHPIAQAVTIEDDEGFALTVPIASVELVASHTASHLTEREPA